MITTEIMDKPNFAFGKLNYILLAAGVIAIILGFALKMSGSKCVSVDPGPIISAKPRIMAITPAASSM